jgi:hypothetical protein
VQAWDLLSLGRCVTDRIPGPGGTDPQGTSAIAAKKL